MSHVLACSPDGLYLEQGAEKRRQSVLCLFHSHELKSSNIHFEISASSCNGTSRMFAK